MKLFAKEKAMIINPIKTQRVTSGSISLIDLIDQSIDQFQEKDILVITSKIVSLCEANTVALDQANKETLVSQESQLRLPATASNYGISFTIAQNSLIPSAGIDESNGGDYYILWPKDSQKTANQVRAHLKQRFRLDEVGVIISDSTCQPMRRGTTGIALAHSGFQSLHNYIGQPDLFGRPFKVSQSNVSGGLASAAVVCMGEGVEQTPLCRISDAGFVSFQDRDPSAEELAENTISIEEDLFAPFLQAVAWEKN
jgi:putative folate metabolism gamma-glutamate ligase